LIAAAVVFSSVSLQAQTRRARKPAAKTTQTTTDASKWPLESVTVKGNSHFTRDQIVAASGLHLGKPVTKSDFDAARDRLVASGAFTNVSCGYEPAPSGKGYAATIDVVEVPELYPLKTEDLPITDAELQAFAKKRDALAGPKVPGTKEALERYKSYAVEMLAAKNYKDPITASVTSENPPDLIVLIRPAAARPNIVRVKFTGASSIPIPILQNKMADVATGVPYNETTFRILLDNNIRPLYEAKGQVRVAFPSITTQPAADVKGVDVTVQVVEGPVYKLGRVQVAGAPNEPELTKLVQLKSGQIIDFDEIKAAAQTLERNFRRQGYLDVSTNIERHYNDAEKSVDITLRVNPGARFMFTKLNIVGLDIESEPEIRKMWGLKEGKPFNIDYPDHFLKVVKDNGVFDNLKTTRSENKIDHSTHTVEVTLFFNK
jgi:outer membrane protein assembly factor BamA